MQEGAGAPTLTAVRPYGGSWTMAADGIGVAPTDETYGNLPYNFPKEEQRHARSQHHRPA